MMVAIAHAAPTAPAPIIPIFMMCPPLCSGFSVKAVEPNGEQGRRHVLDSEKDQPFPSRKDEIGAALVERTGNHESPCVEPYAASCRELFE